MSSTRGSRHPAWHFHPRGHPAVDRRPPTSLHAPMPPTLFLVFLSSVLSFLFFLSPLLGTQGPHDSVSPSLLNSICTKSFALVWSSGSCLESPSTCASKLPSGRPAPSARLPPISGWGCPGAAECVGPHPPLAWSGSSEHRANLTFRCRAARSVPLPARVSPEALDSSINSVTATCLRVLHFELFG